MSNEEQEAPGQAGNKQGLCLRILSTNPTRTTRQQPVIYQCECLKRISESSWWVHRSCLAVLVPVAVGSGGPGATVPAGLRGLRGRVGFALRVCQ